MEKNKSVLIASISGIVACLVCIGLVFLFTPKGSNELKGNDKLPTQQDEIKLGDDCSSCVSYCMATSGHTLDYCNTSCGCSGSTTPQTYCCCNAARTTCSNRSTCLSSDGNVTVGVNISDSACQTYIITPPSPETPTTNPPVLTCTNPKYDGTEKIIATCSGGTIISGRYKTEVGFQNVICTNGDQRTDKTCGVDKGDGQISNFASMSIEHGKSVTLSATGTGAISYSIVSGSDKISLSGNTITAGTTSGSARVRATSAGTSNYNAATKDITVTVIAPTSTSSSSTGCCYLQSGEYKFSSTTTADMCHGTMITQSECESKNPSTNGCCYLQNGEYKFSSTTSANMCHGTMITQSECESKNPSANGCCYLQNGEYKFSSTTTADMCHGTMITQSECESKSASSTDSCVDNKIDRGSCYNGIALNRGDKCTIPNGMTCSYLSSGYEYSSGTIMNWECSRTASAISLTCNKLDVSYTITFAYADGLGRVTKTCHTDSNGKIIQPCDEGTHDWCGKYSPYPCEGYDCKNGLGRNAQGAKTYDYYLNLTYTGNATYYCVAGTSGGPAVQTPTTVTPTPTPTATPEPKTPKCYIDENNDYHWTSNPQSNWVIAKKDGKEITNKNMCPPKPGCYEDTKGIYVWGEYSTSEGYIYHSEITDEDKCINDTSSACYKMDSEYNCYKKNDDYVLAKTTPEGYTKVDDKSLCGNEYIWSKEDKTGYTKTDLPYNKCENPACYYNEKSKVRVWGYYGKVNGYYMLVDDNDNPLPKDQCRNDMCYKDPDGDYVWGDYESYPGFTKMPDLSINECGIDVPTPKTAINVSKVVYIFMAVLMAAGIGFIYYSTMQKKEN